MNNSLDALVKETDKPIHVKLENKRLEQVPGVAQISPADTIV